MKILDTQIVFRDGNFVAFPSLAYLKDGTVMCAFRHAPDRVKEYGKFYHLDPGGKDVYLLSHDGGHTFEPELHTIVDEEMVSNQDPCLTVLSSGRILCTSYRWIFAPRGEGPAVWGEDRYKHCGLPFFDKYDSFIGDANCSYSDDNGKTWKFVPKVAIEGTPCGLAVRANIVELPNGDLLMPVYNKLALGEHASCRIMRSTDQGESWEEYSVLAAPHETKNFVEPNIFRTQSGRLVALIRTQIDRNAQMQRPGEEVYQNVHTTYSDDDGKTWAPVTEVENFWGSNPINMLQLKSGKVLVSYGYRRAPFGIRARVCNADLSDVSTAEEIIIRDDSPHGDLGYTYSIQLDNGDILMVYYITDETDHRTITITRLRED